MQCPLIRPVKVGWWQWGASGKRRVQANEKWAVWVYSIENKLIIWIEF